MKRFIELTQYPERACCTTSEVEVIFRLCDSLSSEFADYVKYSGNYNAEENGSGKREIKCCLLPTIKDVTRKPSDGHARTAKNQVQHSEQQQSYANENEDFTEFCHKLNNRE